MGMMHFVGVGPGDPELLTLKAVRLIREADCIAVADGGGGKCTALDIARGVAIDKPVLRLSIPMHGAAPDWQRAHEAAAALLLERLAAGQTLVYLVLGDPSIYASSGYLLRRIKGKHPCEVTAGIPSFCEAAAKLQIALCEGRQSLHILPGYAPANGLPAGNAVVMKAGKNLGQLRAALQGREAYLAQNIGLPGEKIGALEEAETDAGDTQPYFSTVIVKCGENSHSAIDS